MCYYFYMKNKFICVGYARISKKNRHARGVETDESRSEQSIEHQKEYIRVFCENHPQYDLIDIFSDTKSGALSSNRDGFLKALEYFNKGVKGCNSLIVYQKDRLGRNAIEYIKLLWDAQSQGKYIFELTSTQDEPICLTHNLGSNKGTNQMLNVVQDAMDAFAMEAYLMSLSEKAIQFNKNKILKKNGFYTGGKVLFGYKLVEEPELHFEIVEEEAEAIRLVYKLYLENKWGARRIMNYLNQKGYSFRDAKNNHHIFTYDNVQRILEHKEYGTGEKIIWKKSSIILRKQLHRDLIRAFPQYSSPNYISEEELAEFLKDYNDGNTDFNYVVKDVYPVIIDKETYSRFLVEKENRGPAFKEPLEPNETGWLSGIIYCECGCKMFCHGKRIAHFVRHNKNGSNVPYELNNYYKCRSYVDGTLKKQVGTHCSAKKGTVSYNIDNVIYQFLCDLIDNTTVKDRIAKSISQKTVELDSSKSKESRAKYLREIIKDKNKEISLISERKINGYYDNDPGIGPTMDDFKKELTEAREAKNDAYNALNKLTYETSSLENQLYDYNNAVKAWENFKNEDKSGFLHAFLSKVETKWTDDGLLYLYLYLKVFENAKIDGKDINPILLKINPKDLRKKPKPYKRHNPWEGRKRKRDS